MQAVGLCAFGPFSLLLTAQHSKTKFEVFHGALGLMRDELIAVRKIASSTLDWAISIL